MVGKFVKGRTALFIDASNIYFSQRRLGWQVDFLKLLKYFQEETKLWKAFFYTAYDPAHKSQKKFLDFLDLNGFVVRTKKVKFIKDRSTGKKFGKGNLDVELTIDAVDLQKEFDSFLLFSGDSDFEPLIKYLKGKRKRCLVFSVKDHVSVELLKQAKFINIKKLAGWLEKQNSPGKPGKFGTALP